MSRVYVGGSAATATYLGAVRPSSILVDGSEVAETEPFRVVVLGQSEHQQFATRGFADPADVPAVLDPSALRVAYSTNNRAQGFALPASVVVHDVTDATPGTGTLVTLSNWLATRFPGRRFEVALQACEGNRWFPDLNGVWVGTTNSNWPTVKKLVETALSTGKVTEQDLHDTPEQRDAMAVQITNSLFTLRIAAGLSSTDGESHSITAKPWRHQHTDRIHLSYVYEQHTPNHAATDEETHLGAADLALTRDDVSQASGTYWTRRSWRTGRNTAGTLELSRLEPRKAKDISLRDYAAAHKAKIKG